MELRVQIHPLLYFCVRRNLSIGDVLNIYKSAGSGPAQDQVGANYE
jgi:hypothetical protein